MPKKQDDKKDLLMYKGKPLIRTGNTIYYGDPNDAFIITMVINKSDTILGLPVSTDVTIYLQTNIPGSLGKGKTIKKAERDGLYRALDIGSIWLEDALENA